MMYTVYLVVGNSNSRAEFHIDRLPSGVTSLYRAFRYCSSNSYIDIGKIINHAPAEGFTSLSNVVGFCDGTPCGGGSVAKFLQKCPSVTTVRDANGRECPFQSLNNSLMNFDADDHFECIVEIPEDNYTWGFIPTSSSGTWYMILWGDEVPAKGKSLNNPYNYSLVYTFTSGTKIEHTYAKAGTYTIKLAMKAETVLFDPYVSDNGKFTALGSPTVL